MRIRRRILRPVNTLHMHVIHRGSYMSAHVLLNLLNELGKRDKMRGLRRHMINVALFNLTCTLEKNVQK